MLEITEEIFSLKNPFKLSKTKCLMSRVVWIMFKGPENSLPQTLSPQTLLSHHLVSP